nr:unnamed protein product [Spirometra erinaceieuropaei]
MDAARQKKSTEVFAVDGLLLLALDWFNKPNPHCPSATEGGPAEGAEADKRPARERISACKRSADSGFRSRPGTSTEACSSSPDLHSQDREADSDLLPNSSGPDGTMTIDSREPLVSLPPRKVEKLSLAAEGMAYCQSLDGDCSPCDSSSTSPQDRISNGSGTFDFPSLTTSGVAQYAKRRLSVEGLPTPGSTDATYACALRLKHIVRLVERNRITKNVLLDNLEYAIQVVEKTYLEETRRLRDEDEDLSEAACSEVPDEVRDWLSTTFKRNAGTGNLNATKPHFRSVANAIRAGIVVDRIYRRMSSCSNITLPPNLMLMLKGGLDDWNFDVFEFNEVSENHALKYVGFELLHKYNLISKFQLDTNRLESLLLRLEIGYSKYKNPYHNLVHAADVAQTCHVVMTMSRLRDYLTDLDVFAVVYAALIHDFEHTGTTNNFHVQTQTELALLYNDRNVLESYHVSAVFRITKEAEFNIFEKMPKEQYQEFRASVIEMVLNTDMSLHFSQMVASDSDIRFMALNDMINELQNGTLYLDPENEQSIVRAVLNLLRDKSGEVQSLSVTALSLITKAVSNQEISRIISDLVSSMANGETGQTRSICGIGLKSVINALQPSNPSVIELVSQESVKPLVLMIGRHPDMTVRIEACEILSAILTRFGASLTTQHNDILECLLISLSDSNSPLRKRAVQTLGALTWTASDEAYTASLTYVLCRIDSVISSLTVPADVIVAEISLLQRPSLSAALKSPVNMEEFKTLFQCLAILARSPQRMSSQVPSLLENLINLLRQPYVAITALKGGRQSSGEEEDADEIRELGIQVLDILIRRAAWLVAPKLTEIVTLLLEFLQHDPNYAYGPDGKNRSQMDIDARTDEDDDVFSGDEDEDDEAYSDEDEDSSWKVRRAAAKGLEACISSYPEHLGDFYETVAPALVSRFDERVESVRLEIFACTSVLLSKTRVTVMHGRADTPSFHGPSWIQKVAELNSRLMDPKSPQTQLFKLLPVLCQAISRQVSPQASSGGRRSSGQTAKANLPSRQAAFLLLRGLAWALPGHLGPHLGTILGLISADLTEQGTSNTAKIEMVNLLILLVKTHDYLCFADLKDLLNKLTIMAVSDSFYRVALDGMDLAQQLTVRPKDSRDDLRPIFPALMAQLKATASDLELKEKAVSTVSVYLSFLGDHLPQADLKECLSVLLSRLKNESTRLVTVRAINKICTVQLNVDLTDFLKETVAELANCLNKKDRLLRIAALRCLTAICEHFPSIVLQNACLVTILTYLPQLISDHDLQTSQGTVQLVATMLEFSSKAGDVVSGRVVDLITSDAFLNPLVVLAHSTLLHGQTLDSVLFLMQCIGHFRSSQPGCKLTIQFVLGRLLQPLIDAQAEVQETGRQSDTKTVQNRDALPYLARCITELLAQLPLASPRSAPVTAQPDSIHAAVDELISVIKDTRAPIVNRYLNILVLGELGRRINLSDRKDLLQLLLSYVDMPVNTATEDSSTGGGGGGGGSRGLPLASEIRPAAAVSLGRLVVGQPTTLLPFLLKAVNDAAAVEKPDASSGIDVGKAAYSQRLSFYYLLQALREAVVNLLEVNAIDCIRANLDTLWSLLLANSGRPEEGSRNLVAECLGRISLISPQLLIGRLQTQLNSPQAANSALTRCTLVTAAKYILVVSEGGASGTTLETTDPPNSPSPEASISPGGTFGRPDHTSASFQFEEAESVLCGGGGSGSGGAAGVPLADFLARLLDPDLNVRKAALLTLNTAAHHRSGLLIRPLLNRPLVSAALRTGEWKTDPPTLLQVLYRETLVRPELIREVEMGPFKRQEDDGLDLRKSAYECLSTLLDTCVDSLHMSDFLDLLINGLKDHNDIRLLVYHMLQRIIQLQPLEVTQSKCPPSPPLFALYSGNIRKFTRNS